MSRSDTLPSSSSLEVVLSRKLLPGLDAMRAVAVSLVFGFHFLLLPSGSGAPGRHDFLRS